MDREGQRSDIKEGDRGPDIRRNGASNRPRRIFDRDVLGAGAECHTASAIDGGADPTEIVVDRTGIRQPEVLVPAAKVEIGHPEGRAAHGVGRPIRQARQSAFDAQRADRSETGGIAEDRAGISRHGGAGTGQAGGPHIGREGQDCRRGPGRLRSERCDTAGEAEEEAESLHGRLGNLPPPGGWLKPRRPADAAA